MQLKCLSQDLEYTCVQDSRTFIHLSFFSSSSYTIVTPLIAQISFPAYLTPRYAMFAHINLSVTLPGLESLLTVLSRRQI